MANTELDKDVVEEIEEESQPAEEEQVSPPSAPKEEKDDDEITTITFSKNTLWVVIKVAIAIVAGLFVAFAMPVISYWLSCLPMPAWWFIGMVIAAAGTAWACLKKK